MEEAIGGKVEEGARASIPFFSGSIVSLYFIIKYSC